MSIADLIKRVEAATGPDREIDGLAWKLTCEQPGDVWSLEIDGTVWCRQDPDDTIAWDVPPRLTASVDAVIGLIGEKMPGWAWKVETTRPDGEGFCAAVHQQGAGRSLADSIKVVRASTPALSLLLAFLRAWEQRGDG